MEQLFEETVAGRYKQSDGMSSARFWVPKDDTTDVRNTDGGPVPPMAFVPRPDRNLGLLKLLSWFGFLGLDHFYLRSPGTGLAKLLTLGGVGLWWLWDWIQVRFETERVLNYGVSTPFDIFTGIGQGMIYDSNAKDWQYEQQTDFGLWSFCIAIGFTGADMFYIGRFWLGFRKLVIFLLALTAIAPFVVGYINDGLWGALSSVGFFGGMWLILCTMLMIGLMVMYVGDISILLNKPESVMTEGMPISETAVDAFGWIKSLYFNEEGAITPGLEQEWQTIYEHYMFKKSGVSAKELEGRFRIARKGELPVTHFTSTAPAGIIPFTLAKRIVLNTIYSIISAVGYNTPIGRGFKIANALVPNAVAVATPLTNGVKNISDIRHNLLNRIGVPAVGGARKEPLSTEAQIMGATVIALIAGGSLKGLVDYLMKE